MNDNLVVILSTSSCIKCKSMIPHLKELLDAEDISYVQLDALESGGLELVKKFNIYTVPTVLVYENKDKEPHIFTGDYEPEDILNCVRGKV